MKFLLWNYSSSSSSSTSDLLSYCVKEKKPCIGWWWVEEYFKDCLCNANDQASFGLGIISLVCWGVAEIPQIITNFYTKSSHGVSLIFLLTWIAGDIFNLVGCLLEPATLPTQYYTALLYTTSTVILVLQSLYYDHIYVWFKSSWKSNDADSPPEVEEAKKPLKPKTASSQSRAIRAAPSHQHDYYYTSARSMAASSTPPYLWTTRSGPASAMVINDDDDSSEDESFVRIPKTASQPRPIPRSVGYGAFLATTLNLPSHTKGLVQEHAYKNLLQLQDNGGNHIVYGQWLGWMMAAIYMGGRIPQIALNIKRGSVEGLNPLMFIFALVANATYVGSILVRSTEWEKIKANMPWLLDAIVCVALDAFIIMQYVYYRHFLKRVPNTDGEYHSDY